MHNELYLESEKHILDHEMHLNNKAVLLTHDSIRAKIENGAIPL